MLQRLLILAILFLAGFLSHTLYQAFQTPSDLHGPADRIREDQVEIRPDQVILHLPQAQFAAFTATHSMDPLLDSDSNALEIIPQHENDIHLGDIVSYEYKGDTLIHRVVGIGKDEQGSYFVMKGDNNPEPDPEKVRFNQIQRVLVAILY